MTGTPLMQLALWVAAGLALGAVYLLMLSQSVSVITGAGGWVRAVAWLILRVAVAATTLWMAAQNGALAILLLLAGFMIARTATTQWMRRADHGG
jgi:hypothetical protein